MPKNSTWSTPAKLGKIFALHYTAASFSSNFQVKMIDSDYSESEEDLGNGLKKRKIKLSDGEDKNVKGITDFCVVRESGFDPLSPYGCKFFNLF